MPACIHRNVVISNDEVAALHLSQSTQDDCQHFIETQQAPAARRPWRPKR
jgi:hypothetical protein